MRYHVLVLSRPFGHDKEGSAMNQSALSAEVIDAVKARARDLTSVLHVMNVTNDSELQWNFADYLAPHEARQLATSLNGMSQLRATVHGEFLHMPYSVGAIRGDARHAAVDRLVEQVKQIIAHKVAMSEWLNKPMG